MDRRHLNSSFSYENQGEAEDRSIARIFHAFEMFIGKTSGAPLYACYRKSLITKQMGISGVPVG